MNKVNSAAQLREFIVLNVDEICSQTSQRFSWGCTFPSLMEDRNLRHSCRMDLVEPITRTSILPFRPFSSSAPEDAQSAIS